MTEQRHSGALVVREVLSTSLRASRAPRGGNSSWSWGCKLERPQGPGRGLRAGSKPSGDMVVRNAHAPSKGCCSSVQFHLLIFQKPRYFVHANS